MDIIGDKDTGVSMRDITEMRYLDKVVKETLRLYPSVPMAGRELEKDIVLSDGLLLPKGTNLFIQFYDMHRDPTVRIKSVFKGSTEPSSSSFLQSNTK